MCQAIAEGGRRCASSTCAETTQQRNVRRRENRAARARIARWAHRSPAHGPQVAAQLRSGTPGQAREWALTNRVPAEVIDGSSSDATDAGANARAGIASVGGVTGFGFQDPDLPRVSSKYRSRERAAEAEEYGAAYEGWAEGLSEDEQDALEQYTQVSFEGVNEAFYNGRGLSGLSLNERAVVDGLDGALAKAPRSREPVTLWRGVQPGGDWINDAGWSAESSEQWAREGFPVGSSVQFPSYTSTSRSPSVADVAATDKGVVFEMRTRQGAYVGGLGAYGDSEQEHLIGRDSSWTVVGVESNVAFDTPGQERSYRTVVYLVDESLVDRPAGEGSTAPAFSARPTSGWQRPQPTRAADRVLVPDRTSSEAGDEGGAQGGGSSEDPTGADDVDAWMESMLAGEDTADDGWGTDDTW